MIIAKFIQWLRDDTIITQEQILSKVVIEEQLKGYWTCEFTMPIVEGVEEDVVVEIYEIWNSDTLIFRWYIHQIKPIWQQFWLMEVVLIQEKAVMQRRHALSDRSFSNQWFSTVLTTLLDDFDTYGESWSINTDISSNISQEVLKWESYYDLFDELAEEFEARRWIHDWVLYFKQSYWEDRSDWQNYQEVIYDHNNPSSANISNIELVGIAKKATVLIWKDKSGNFNTNTGNYSETLYWTHVEYFRDGNLAEKTAKKAEQLSKKQRSYKVTVDQNSINADVWDTIRLTVSNTNSFFDIDASVTVSKKKITVENSQKIVEYELQEFTITPVTSDWFQRKLNKKINLLQL